MDIDLSQTLAKASEAKVVTIIEEKTKADGSFVVGTLLSTHAAKKHKIILILHHHGFGHFQGVCTKLGFNLQALKDSGRLLVIDVLDMIGTAALRNNHPEEELESLLLDALSLASTAVENDSVIIVDHPGDVILAFRNQTTILNYVRCIQNLSSNLIFITGPAIEPLKVLNALMRHGSEITIFVRDLATGVAADISGILEIVGREGRKVESVYHYQLMDRRVKLFAPGFVQIR